MPRRIRRIGEERIKRHKRAMMADLRRSQKPDWNKPCEVCEAVPTMPLTGMCGPCTTGEANTVDGNW